MPIGLFELTRYLETCQDITASEGGAPSYPFITRGLLYAVLVTHYVLVLAASPMPAQTDIPSALSDDDKAFIFQFLDAWLNTAILYALLHGIYTGILAVSLWTICELRAPLLGHLR
ncbi:hypothetical protein EDD18DRAFT_203325 [Armillaria luteobubalina]|uniref:Uncharacterized protein n=1 Tax=Armillaria luteobubalina TaxID=153913 RepID=A0AA39Q4Z9_9AGAR|nr:hypothetical protein EDD18DRAFT_203325 [Armillaria luteobubalina]